KNGASAGPSFVSPSERAPTERAPTARAAAAAGPANDGSAGAETSRRRLNGTFVQYTLTGMLRPLPRLNPRNRWERTHVTYEAGEAPEVPLELFEDETRRILSENDSPDLSFRYSVNAYRGCAHGCAYCYARPSHEYLGFGAGADFERRLVVKRRAPELLREAFERPGWRGDLIVFSGNTDAYQPIEARFGLTRRCLEVC